MSIEKSEIKTRRRRWPFYGAGLVLVWLAIGARIGTADSAIAAETLDVEETAAPEAEPDELSLLLERARSADQALRRAESLYDAEVAPIQAVLRSYRDDPELTRRIALALVREARRANVEPRVLLAVLLVENPMLEPRARSFVGAVGLMQVMPLHRGRWPGCRPDLESIESNICHGAQIFAAYLRQSQGNVDRALLRYNGCVRGTNTPDCHSYPNWVYARAGRVSVMSWLASVRSPAVGGAAAP